MPIYEYACNECDTKFERLVKAISGRDSVECPKCGSSKTARALSVFAVGAESGGRAAEAPAPGMCGRCGGPGPCGAN